MSPPQKVIIKRPTKKETFVYTIKSNDWEKMITLPKDVDVWLLHNQSMAQPIRYAYREKPKYFDTIGIDGRVTEETSPRDIWVQRTNAATQPTVYIEYWKH